MENQRNKRRYFYCYRRSAGIEEMQIFDRKSVNIEPKALAIPLIAFANADGGTVAIGISDKTRRIEGAIMIFRN